MLAGIAVTITDRICRRDHHKRDDEYLMKYYPWVEDDEDDSLAWITRTSSFLNDFQKSYELFKGISVQSWWPPDMVFQLSDDHGVKLTDSIPNTLNMNIVSERLKGLLVEKSGAEIEFLPVRIRNQKERMLDEPYYVMNPLGSIPCMDRERSEFKDSALNPDQVRKFLKLVLDESKIPSEAKLFRLAEKKNLVLTREDLAKDILRAGCDGMIFVDLEDFGSEWRY